MGGTDVNASLSASSSATSGAQSRSQHGDFIVGGGKKPTPPWVWVGLAIAGALVLVVFIVRR